jgi:CoA-transferase family III
LGEHTESILAEAAAIKAPAAAVPRSPGLPTQQQAGPLQGVRVLELTKIWAGPYTGKLLALLGAEVIRVESYDSLDATRRYGVKDINDAPGFQAINPGKCSVQFNVRTDEGRRLVKELVKVSDIFIENLRPGAAGRLGLGYDVLRSLKPQIVAVSMSMYGHEGPLSYQTGYAPCFSALAGVCNLVGYEGGPPQLRHRGRFRRNRRALSPTAHRPGPICGCICRGILGRDAGRLIHGVLLDRTRTWEGREPPHRDGTARLLSMHGRRVDKHRRADG